jgi:hypothetical protein
MAETRFRRKATKKAPVRRKGPVVAKARLKVKAGQAAARRRLRGGKRSARAVVRKVRSIGAGLIAAGAAAVQSRRSAPPPPPEISAAGSEEERIESSKYLPRRADKLFEAGRFVFPESYGMNRLRLLVKDPEWLFAHWDVDAGVLAAMRKDIGERAMALARLTLRLSDPLEGGSTVILLPKGVRAWYIRADEEPRSYRAELGLTLPSGEFRPLATSNTVGTPRVGPAPAAAQTRVTFRPSGDHVAEVARAWDGTRTSPGHRAGSRVVAKQGSRKGRDGSASEGPGERPGEGASDTYRR